MYNHKVIWFLVLNWNYINKSLVLKLKTNNLLLQARAPNSPVLIIGTHYDLVKEKFPPSWSEDLQQMIRDRFINVIDADKLGLPRVLDTIEVSC